MESVNGLYKAECIRTLVFHDGPYKTIADVEYATAGWSTGTTTAGSMGPWEWSHQSSTSKPTTLPSTESRNPYENGREPGALHTGRRGLEGLVCLEMRDGHCPILRRSIR